MLRRIVVMLFGLLMMGQAIAQVSASEGKILSKACVACHGDTGNSSVATWPKLAGQNSRYLIQQILAFKAGEKGPRYNVSMYPMVANLTDTQIEDLAEFYAEQKITLGVASPTLVKQGQALYRGGSLSDHIAACGACHGPRGLGNPEAGFPALGGQHAQYIVQQLEAYKSGSRKTGAENGMMHAIAKRMSKQQMQAVASYISGLH